MWVWNDYLLPTLVLDIKKYRTIPMLIQYFRGSYGRVEMGPMMAVSYTHLDVYKRQVLPVLVQRRGADAVQLAPRQHGLEDIARVHGLSLIHIYRDRRPALEPRGHDGVWRNGNGRAAGNHPL